MQPCGRRCEGSPHLISAAATTMGIHPPNTVTMTCLFRDQICRFGMSSTRHPAALGPSGPFRHGAAGIQHASIGDCALLLDVPRRVVGGRYCQAFRWNSERTDADGWPHEDRVDSHSELHQRQEQKAGAEDKDTRKKRNDAENKNENAHGTELILRPSCSESYAPQAEEPCP